MDDAYLARCGVQLQRRVAEATAELRRFAAGGPCYLGTSWGKDSLCVAHLIAMSGLPIPVVRVRCEPIENPDCDRVRDAFLAQYAICYHEAIVWCRRDPDGWHATGTLEAGLEKAAQLAGATRYITGIRAAESGVRKMRVLAHGLSTARTCAPIGRWTGADVFAYLRLHDLPVHPAYACSFGETLDRERLRVSFLALDIGGSHGKEQWERHYYGDALRAIDAMTAPGADPVPRPMRARGSWRPRRGRR